MSQNPAHSFDSSLQRPARLGSHALTTLATRLTRQPDTAERSRNASTLTYSHTKRVSRALDRPERRERSRSCVYQGPFLRRSLRDLGKKADPSLLTPLNPPRAWRAFSPRASPAARPPTREGALGERVSAPAGSARLRHRCAIAQEQCGARPRPLLAAGCRRRVASFQL